MGRPHNIPRNYKGENKILFVFSNKAFMFTGIGAGIGIIFYMILKMFKLMKLGMIIVLIFAFIGFFISTFKMPEIKKFELTRKTGGEPIDQILYRWIKFKRKKNRIYIYKEEVNKNVE